jgi:hypothetical protein
MMVDSSRPRQTPQLIAHATTTLLTVIFGILVDLLKTNTSRLGLGFSSNEFFYSFCKSILSFSKFSKTNLSPPNLANLVKWATTFAGATVGPMAVRVSLFSKSFNFFV